jgi:4-amino-4-deoxy-L-arabinose transferase-like glycosyltransferase
VKRFYQIWLIALVVKTALAIWLPFSNDEAYYWVWGHHPQWSYFDHPPIIGWLFYLGTWLESFGNAARLPGVWLAHATLLIWQKIIEPYLDDTNRAMWLLFVLFSPFLGVGSLIVTPDVPLMFFWSLSLLTLLKLLEKPSFNLYAALGIFLGLGFCSKYLIALFVPIALLWLFWSGEWRRIRWALVPLTIVFGLLFCLPVFYWNANNHWASFQFQLNHGLSSNKWEAIWPGEYLAGQLLILFPTVVWLATRRREPMRANFLHFFGWLPIAFFLYTSFRAHVEANWPIMAHPALLSLAFLNAPNSKWLKGTVLVWIFAHLIVFSEIAHHWLPVDPDKLKTAEFTRYDAFAKFAAQHPRNLYFGSYQQAAAISYKLRHQYYKLEGMNRVDFYDFVPQSMPKSDSFWVGAEMNIPIPEKLTEMGYGESQSNQITKEFRLFEVTRRAQGTNR